MVTPPGDLACDRPARGLRKDAEANRERILAAAERVFAERGLDAGVDEIARAAGVGMGTLYRRFPTKEELVGAVVELRVGELAAAARAGLEAEDAWEALRGALRAWAAAQAEHRGFLEAVAERYPRTDHLVAVRDELLDAYAPLLRRAQEEGLVRGDLVVEDLPFLLCGIGRRPRGDLGLPPDLWERYFALTLDGLRAAAPTPLPAPAPSRSPGLPLGVEPA
jgi:AcrR family transcriptional regulator